MAMRCSFVIAFSFVATFFYSFFIAQIALLGLKVSVACFTVNKLLGFPKTRVFRIEWIGV